MKKIINILLRGLLKICPYLIIVLVAYGIYLIILPIKSVFSFAIIILLALFMFNVYNRFIKSKRNTKKEIEEILADHYVNKRIVGEIICQLENSIDVILAMINQNKTNSRLLKNQLANEQDRIDNDMAKYMEFCEKTENLQYTLHDLFSRVTNYFDTYLFRKSEIEIVTRLDKNLTNDLVMNGNLSISFEIILLIIEYLSEKPENWESKTIEILISRKYEILVIEIIRKKSRNKPANKCISAIENDLKLARAKIWVEKCNMEIKQILDKNIESYTLLFLN